MEIPKNIRKEHIKKKTGIQYWLFAPGQNASKWTEFYNEGIMGLGWDDLGDLNNYNSKNEIVKQLQKLENTTSSKKNDATANFDFKENIAIGDIIIIKKGRSEYLGYGIVTSDYYYDDNRTDYKKCRKVNWIKKGIWKELESKTVLKTLTNITPYFDYVEKIISLIGIKTPTKNFSEQLISFLEQAKTDNLKTKHYSREYNGTKVKVSFGQGVSARIPWISFLKEPFTTSEGIYPVYLYYKNENKLVLAYGISETKKPQVNWGISNPIMIKDYFNKNSLSKPDRYGDSFLFKIYDTDSLPSIEILDSDLNEIIEQYQSINMGNDTLAISQSNFNISQFHLDCTTANLKYSNQLVTRYISSLVTKPFVLLSGLSGSGKTKLAQSFAQWICEDEKQYCIVPVGADWTNREPLLGYVNALDNKEYIFPENGALQLLIEANKKENEHNPYFLILDEMNLSHVERYFADFLSVMESKDKFKLHTDKENEKSGVPHELDWPKNLFVVGTVNIDETTYMFSPKVLDRANVIEFRVNETEIEDFLYAGKEITSITKMGAAMGNSFVDIAKNNKNEGDFGKLNTELLDFFKELQKLGAEFGYRTASEIQTLFSKIDLVNPVYSDKENEKIDIAIMQKLLPKLHGSRRKLLKTLNLLAQKCLAKEQETIFNERGVYTISEDNEIKYTLSFEKIARMYKNAIENGFASYAEA